ncbi:HasR, partial [Pasteurella multocida subsp. multocida str. Anand1_cattle]
CLSNDTGLCQTQTYAPNARYSSHGFDLNAYNYSLAFANNGKMLILYLRMQNVNRATILLGVMDKPQ